MYNWWRYITGLKRTFEYKVIVVWNCSELLLSISSIFLYYGTQSDIRVKAYCRSNFLRASFFNFKRLDILRHSVGHPLKYLLPFEFSKSFRFQFVASRYITGVNRTSVYEVIIVSIFLELLVSILSISRYITRFNRTSLKKVIVVWTSYKLPFSISTVSINYRTHPDIRV